MAATAERSKPVSEMSKREKEDRIDDLLSKLRRESDPVAKKNIRAKLRHLGHEGGTGDRGPAMKSARKKLQKQKQKNKRAQKREAVSA